MKSQCFAAHLFLLCLPFPLFAQPGSIDITYATNGWLIDSIGPIGCQSRAIAMSQDGSAYVIGACQGGPDVRVLHLTANGTLDPAYGVVGAAEYDLPGITTPDLARGAAVQADGKLLIGGSALVPGHGDEFMLIRLLPNGDLDSTFGLNGVLIHNFTSSDDQANGMLLLASGKILMYGMRLPGGPIGFVARFNTDGSLDSTFNSVGSRAIGSGFSSQIHDAVELPDGRVVVVGDATTYAWAARLMADGTVDPSFPVTTYSFNDGTWMYASRIALRADGSYVFCGSLTNAPSGVIAVGLAQDGEVDPAFGTNGAFRPNLGDKSYGIECSDTDGSCRVVGYGVVDGEFQVMVSKLLNNGQLDPAYIGGGIGWYDTVPLYYAFCSNVQDDGKLLVGGVGYGRMAIMRLNDDISTSTRPDQVEETSTTELVLRYDPSDQSWWAEPLTGVGQPTYRILDSGGRQCVSQKSNTSGPLRLRTELLCDGLYFVLEELNGNRRLGRLVVAGGD